MLTTLCVNVISQKLSLMAQYPDLDDPEQFTLACVYQKAGLVCGQQVDLARVFPQTRIAAGALAGSSCLLIV